MLPEIEQAVVVGLVGAASRIVNPDGVVAEPLPDPLARAHGHQVNGELGARPRADGRTGTGGRRACAEG